MTKGCDNDTRIFMIKKSTSHFKSLSHTTSCEKDDQPCYFVEKTCLGGLVAKSGSSPYITHFRFQDMQDFMSLSNPLYNMINLNTGDK